VKFWDTSAIVPLLRSEPSTPAVLDVLTSDPLIVVWWGTPVECVSAVARLERDGDLDLAASANALEVLAELQLGWTEIEPSERLRAQAMRLLRVHGLRAADSLQLAAALVAAEQDPRSMPMVTLDERLATAARREGFTVLLSP
jgi:predicted nucleic acid-binding protein